MRTTGSRRPSAMHYPLPSSVEIGGVRYKVDVSPPGVSYEPLNYDLLGETNNRRAVIWLHSDQAAEQMNITFWHEVMHAAEYLIGTPDAGEDRCNALANVVCQVLKQL